MKLSEDKIGLIAMLIVFVFSLILAKLVGYILSQYRFANVAELIVAVLFMTTFYAPAKYLLNKFAGEKNDDLQD